MKKLFGNKRILPKYNYSKKDVEKIIVHYKLKHADLIFVEQFNHLQDKLVKVFSGSIYAHVMLVIKYKGKLLVTESNVLYPEEEYDDLVKGYNKSGPMIGYLVDRLRTLLNLGSNVYIRSLNKEFKDSENKIYESYKILSKRPFEKSISQMVNSILDIVTNNKEDLSAIFCSEYIAYLFILLGWLKSVENGGLASKYYSPQDLVDLQLDLGQLFRYGPIIKIDVDYRKIKTSQLYWDDKINNTRIILGGDVMIGRLFNSVIQKNPSFNIWGKNLKSHLENSDLFVFNLETTLTKANTKYPKKRFNYKLLPEYAKIALNNISQNIYCSLANNHILDFGIKGLKETIRTLKSLNIEHTGAGLNLKEAQKLVVMNINETRIGFLSAADHYSYWAATSTKPGIWYINPQKHDQEVLNIVKKSKKKCDLLIFSCHMQSNYVDVIDENIKLFYRSLIDEGVDIVHGHSPHHILPVEKYKNGYIFYSLGDLIDDYAIDRHYRNDLGVLIDVIIQNKKIQIKYHPTLIKDFNVKFLLPSTKDYKILINNILNSKNKY